MRVNREGEGGREGGREREVWREGRRGRGCSKLHYLSTPLTQTTRWHSVVP